MDKTVVIYKDKFILIDDSIDDYTNETLFFNIKDGVLTTLKLFPDYQHTTYHPLYRLSFSMVNGEICKPSFDSDNFLDNLYFTLETYPTSQIIFNILDDLKPSVPKIWFYLKSDINKCYSMRYTLSSNNENIYYDNITILMACTYALNVDLVKYLVDQLDADINVVSQYGFNAFIYLFYGLEKKSASLHRDINEILLSFENILNFLLERGASPDIIFTHKKRGYISTDMYYLYESLCDCENIPKNKLDMIYNYMGYPTEAMVIEDDERFKKN